MWRKLQGFLGLRLCGGCLEKIRGARDGEADEKNRRAGRNDTH